MGLYRSWLEREEWKGFKVHADIKGDHTFEWGLEYLRLKAGSGDPRDLIRRYTEQHVADSRSYFVPPPLPASSYRLTGNDLTFPSPLNSYDHNGDADTINNTVHCRHFPTSDKKNIIIVVPHWNAAVERYDNVCKSLNKRKFSTIRMTLPYHGRRGKEKNDSVKMVSANIGLTIQAMQQCVQDIIATVGWLELQGYERVGILGASIGSCASFLAACHEPRIKGFFANHMSGYFGDVVWTGLSTRHIRRVVENHLKRYELMELWYLNSPIAYLKYVKSYNPSLKQFLMVARYDTTFHYHLSEEVIKEYERQNVSFDHKVLPCGHYTIGKYWFRLIDGLQIIRFFENVFSRS